MLYLKAKNVREFPQFYKIPQIYITDIISNGENNEDLSLR